MKRLTDTHDGPIAVFLIGMTFRKPWRPDQWLPVFVAMPRMIRELEVNKAAAERGEAEWLGFMGARTTLGSNGPTVIQYWRSTDDLIAYASADERIHRPAWRAFNTRARKASGAVGIWHETYAVPAGSHETIYSDLAKAMGLAAVSGTAPLVRRGETARERLGSTAG